MLFDGPINAAIEYLPPYSPDLNPIKMAFTKIKAYMRVAPPRCFEQIVASLAGALDTFSATICSNLFRHANYATD